MNQLFLLRILLSNAVTAALRRAHIYGPAIAGGVTRKKELRRDLRTYLNELSEQYHGRVNDDLHCDNIQLLSYYFSDCYGDVLGNDGFRIGVAQKALNLWLKFLWSLGHIPTPPQCPFDAIVIRQINLEWRCNWTEIRTIEEYIEVVDAAKQVAGRRSLSEWEMDIWMLSRISQMNFQVSAGQI
jgi:hypothetical protein